jgi:hypothetical protein
MALDDTKTTTWVRDRLASLDPSADWRPDPQAARARLAARQAGRQARVARWSWRAAAAAVGLAILAAAPPVRLAAERAWEWLFARDVSVLRVDMERLPQAVREALQAPIITGRIEHRSVASLDEAARIAGFGVHRIAPALAFGTPEVALLLPLSGELVLRVGALEKAAASVNAGDVVVPPTWEGTRIRVETGALVLSEYGDVTLIETTPIGIAVPPDFDLPAFVLVALRLVGFDPAQAMMLAQRAAAGPVAFMAVPPQERVRISEVPLGAGMATLIRGLDDGELILIWHTADRVFALTGPLSDESALTVATSLE